MGAGTAFFRLFALTGPPQGIRIRAFRFLRRRVRWSRESPIAQLVERRTVNPQVPGSSPGRGAKFDCACLDRRGRLAPYFNEWEFQEMRIRMLLIASVLCTATYGCETTSTEFNAAAQPRSEPVYTTGSRLPSNGPAAVQGVSREAWEDDRRNASGNQQIYK